MWLLIILDETGRCCKLDMVPVCLLSPVLDFKLCNRLAKKPIFPDGFEITFPKTGFEKAFPKAGAEFTADRTGFSKLCIFTAISTPPKIGWSDFMQNTCSPAGLA